MAQFLRPNANITQTGFTGGFAEIDEATASDADFAYGANNTAATLEVGLTDPTGTPAAGIRTLRYRIAKVNNGTLDGAGSALSITGSVYQGTTLIAADTARDATGTWTAYSFTPDLSTVTDWTDVRLRFETTAAGGSPANRRGGAVSWAELEVPDGEVVSTGTLNVTDGPDAIAAAGTVVTPAITGTLAVTDAVDGLTAVAGVEVAASLALTDATDTLVAVGGAPVISATLSATDATDALVATGQVSSSGLLATLAVTDDADAVAALGLVVIGASLAANDGADVLIARIGAPAAAITSRVWSWAWQRRVVG